MRKTIFLLILMPAFSSVLNAQRSDFRQSTWSRNSFGNEHHVAFNASFFLSGLGGPGVGYGGEFEYILGREGRFSVHIPFSYATSMDYFGFGGHDGDRFHDFHTLLFAPGFRYHPAGAFRHNDFAMGVQAGYASVITEETYLHNGSSQKTNISSDAFVPMTDVSIQHVSNDGFIVGFYFAVGAVVGGVYGINTQGQAIDNPGYFQIGFKMGGNF